jgi:hypothetical protein
MIRGPRTGAATPTGRSGPWAGLKKSPLSPSIAAMNPKGVFASVCAFAAMAVLASCQRDIGYAVILWGEPTGPAATGAMVRVLQHSQIDGTYIVMAEGERSARELSEGRVRYFEKKTDAESFVKALQPWLTTWAFSAKEDPPPLPIRESASSEAKIVYRLKTGQLLKVLSRGEKKQQVSPYEDYWYEVATEDGFSGWCFGHYLKVFAADTDPAAAAGAIMSQDEVLDKVLGSTWRPAWFQDMISSGEIDLTQIREDVGFFPDPSANIFHLVLPAYSIDFPYQSIERVAAGSYTAGPGLRISVLDDTRITIRYKHKNQSVEGLYVIVGDDIAELIAREKQRRVDIYGGLMAEGAALASSAYGTILLQGDMRFTWNGFDKLVPGVIGSGAGHSGTIDFPYHLAKSLQGTYDGVITFVFDDATGAGGAPAGGRSAPRGAQGVSFLYSRASGGLRLTSLSEDSFKEIEVTRASFSPVIAFFTQSGG